MYEDRNHARVSAALLDWDWVVHNLDGKGRRIRTLSGHVCYLMKPYLKSPPHTTPQKTQTKYSK